MMDGSRIGICIECDRVAPLLAGICLECSGMYAPPGRDPGADDDADADEQAALADLGVVADLSVLANGGGDS